MLENFFYERLINLRMKNGASARDMSLSLGQNESYINKIENRKALPSFKNFLYICEYLGVSPKEFFAEDNSNPKLIQEIIDGLKKLTDDQLSVISELIKNFNKEN